MDKTLELMALDEQIRACESAFRESWVYFEPSSPGKAIRRLKPEFQSEYDHLQNRIVALQEQRAEIRRELNFDLADLEESYGSYQR
jgi:polyhydroxyalkanoate synthesis regulator protein